MNYKYFTPGTREEMKAQYRALCFTHHPDKGGDTKTMQEINAEWSYVQAHDAYTEARARQEQAHADGKKSAGDYHDLDEVEATLREKIEAALNMGLDVELMGLWVWVTGNTKPHKDELKAAGFKWAPKKELQPWYYAGVPTFNRKPQSMDAIRNAYGSIQFSRDEQKQERRTEALIS